MERQNKNACHFTLCSSAAKYTVCGQRNNHSQTEEEAVKSAPWTALCHFNCTFVSWGKKKQATLLSGCLYGGGSYSSGVPYHQHGGPIKFFLYMYEYLYISISIYIYILYMFRHIFKSVSHVTLSFVPLFSFHQISCKIEW